MDRIDRPRFLIAGGIVSVVIFVLDIWFHGTFAANMYVGYPQRPMVEMVALMPFLFVTYIVQLMLFCWMFLRMYPQRGLRSAVWWGLWGGFFIVIPNMQFFVAVRDTSWSMLGMQVIEGMVLTVITGIVFELIYRPKSASPARPSNV